MQTCVANLFRGGLTSSLRASLSWDSRNDRMFPSAGWYDNLFVEYASAYTGSENKFFRIGGFIRHYIHIGGPFVFKQNLEIGVTTSTDPLGVPITERYIVGGIYNIRGYAPFSLGPRLHRGTRRCRAAARHVAARWQHADHQQQRGRVSDLQEGRHLGRAVLRHGQRLQPGEPLLLPVAEAEPLRPIQFDPCFRAGESLIVGIRKSVGFGFRWVSPIGPLRFEWGIPLDAQIGEDPLVFEFTIGNFF